MDNYNDLIQTISLALGSSWASGINLYATLLVLGLGAANGAIVLPEGLEVLSNPMVIGAAGLMYLIEFIVDKVPAVDTGWDGIHTFVRIPAGAMLAAGAIGDVAPAMEISAAILGGTMAASTHATKAGSRVMINTSPEPVSNWVASISEDLLVLAGLWAALEHPVIFILALFLFIILMIWLLPKLWQGIKKVIGYIGRIAGIKNKELPPKIEPDITEDEKSLDKLAQLKNLLDDGALDQEEYNAQKAKILDTL